MPGLRRGIRRAPSLDHLPSVRIRPRKTVTATPEAIAIFATKFKTMTALFIILAVVRLAQLLLVGAFAEGHQWCLTAFFIVTVILAVADLVMFITVHITNKEVERREP